MTGDADSAPPFTPFMAGLPAEVPFVPMEALQRARGGRPFRARIGANESRFPPSPRVVEALKSAAGEARLYGDPEFWDLRSALAARFGVRPRQVSVGEGIDGLLGHVLRLFVGQGDRVVLPQGSYPTMGYHIRGHGGEAVHVPYLQDRVDPQAMSAAARRTGAKILYLANPDNPMGGWITGAEIQAMTEALPPDCVLVLDEAYAEFAPPEALPPLDVSRTNLLRLRTFSKAYGLAGMRVGYVLAHEAICAGFDRIRNHFGVNRLGQIAALAALEDEAHLQATIAASVAAREELTRIARANGLTPLPSATNFVTMDCGRDGVYAKRVLEELAARDLFIRKPGAPGLDRCIRVSAGAPAEMALFAEALPEALKAAAQD
ncbi:pyridoxal phosphate-dependent aminotransferase [Neomegalonema sp.]|uniref:pyridoxal phosphate-dependent aminotransferase n=1 Tax=Neomegalonema sp. TaxID=2039713 RepID=UPI0026017F37|nr:pyridoxal phosphate-dependent aminotransferase [Neomegalonema sp.]MDD2869072.1 pyridoxal phosphate-dependent aminotransferase [Neomegalonema sp.]